MAKHLLIGCGNSRRKYINGGDVTPEWGELTTLDIDPECKPDIVHDLNICPYPFEDNSFDEIHAYDVLEHCGRQGDYRFFFRQFYEFWRILKPGGYFVAKVPSWDGVWAWGDPGHTRLITLESLIFLNQSEYSQVGKTPMTDYRSIWTGDFVVLATKEENSSLAFIMQARK